MDLQRDALLGNGVAAEHLYEDQASGRLSGRPGLEACLKALRKKDVLVLWKLDRLGRDLRHLVNTVHDLNLRGVGLQWLDLVGKGGRSRQVPLNSLARQAVVDLVDFNRARGFSVAGEAPLLVTRCHKRLPTRSLRDIIQK